jgi:hypothetical protein
MLHKRGSVTRWHNFTRKIIALTVAGGASLSAAYAQPGDNFNRNTLGPGWVSVSGTLSVSADELHGTTSAIGAFTAAPNSSAGSVLVFTGGTDLEYGAVALGNIAGGSNAFVKIQGQNGTFNNGAFYTGNNTAGAGTTFFTLSSPVPSPALLDVFFCGTVAEMRITSSAGVQTYSHNYGHRFGDGVGAGTFGTVALDNYIASASACTQGEPAPREDRLMAPAKDKTKE